jgi:putative chitinase
MISLDLIRQSMPNAGQRLDPHMPFIPLAMEDGNITTPERAAAFLAQLAHESGEYRWLEELASGDDYDTRTDLGNTPELDGDGRLYKGHGPIQITGRRNTVACLLALGLKEDTDPRVLMVPEYATRSAVWFWTKGNGQVDLNLLADRSWFRTITRVINGGYNGWNDRLYFYHRNRLILRLPTYTSHEEEEEIRAFQAANGLVVDGDAGRKTFAKLH